ncbi:MULTISPECIES: HipA domain-containing protein [unclassified Bradyrhizobium]|uniref:hypothetical protein n=1 Tax=Bradyrhizobium sp. USDA 4541 TaxID=2817704 RepID=UPI0020A58EE7|nr:hypothetical protein [Bradyrhizobium sp. USDA 4541]MCP1851217.1 hypothetical protein [Bradyrhizobium sp. USDA 4541]
MSASKYKIWAVGSPLNDGVSDSVHVGLATVAKKANADEPNIVRNEVLCNLLARGLFLPCPPGALIENGGEDYFCSLNFNLVGQSLPPTPIGTLVATNTELCWGILMFDVLVMNPDRHKRNLAYDRTTGRVQIFDHSRAFLPLKTTIDPMIALNSGGLGFTFHCLKAEISSMSGFEYWAARFKALPDYFIEQAVAEICAIGYPADKRTVTIDFLKHRRNNIDSIIKNNIGQFPKLPQPAPLPPLPPIPISNPVAPPQTGR